jgi:dihydroorotate dehydrogenase (fumarate)
VDLATRYLGLPLRNPIVAAASPLSTSVEGIRALSDGGVGAIVMYSIFAEQVRSDEGAVRSYLETLEGGVTGASVPVIASLNGSARGSWTAFARDLESAGASAIELNVYVPPGDVRTSARDVEQRHLDALSRVKSHTSLPVAVKISPYLSSVGETAMALDAAGADGIVLFNRFFQPDIDLTDLSVRPDPHLSHPDEGRVPRTWVGALRGRVNASLAGNTGVDTVEDVVKYLLAGADVVMTASALLRHGPAYALTLADGVLDWIRSRGFEDVDAVRGLLSAPLGGDQHALARAGYLAMILQGKRTYLPE